MDSVITMETLIKAQEFYKDSFAQIQCSYQIFVAMAAAILAGFALFTVFSLYKRAKLETELKTQIEDLKGQIKGHKSEFNNMKEIFDSQIKEIKEEKRRNFYRNHNYFKMILGQQSSDTVDIIAEFQKEKGLDESIPYLEEFYKMLSLEYNFKWWIKLEKEKKKENFKKLVERIDNNFKED